MDWLADHLAVAWLAAAVVLGIAEMFSLDLVLAMLAVGALAALVADVAGAPFVVQALVAAATSIAGLALLRPPLVARLHAGPTLTQGHAKLVGQQGVVTTAITGLQTGQVKVGGEVWTAAPYDDTLSIAPGETVEVLQIRGATALVHPIPSLEK